MQCDILFAFFGTAPRMRGSSLEVSGNRFSKPFRILIEYRHQISLTTERHEGKLHLRVGLTALAHQQDILYIS
jgi:hypothetical protein